ncbi:MAG TPA: S41 family peptidase [Pyrinomonadaceae bacterium]|nr:S41 family peptidase [Pyrinomonadaceae bacterium]
MIKKLSLLLMTGVIAAGFSLNTFSQQRPRTSSTEPRRQTTRRVRLDADPLIAKDVEEALKVIERHYVEGASLDYNSVFKSSILGMLRSLDPHSNYYDKDEYEELRTDQRSEYFGIGASILNYTIGQDADTFITATFPNSPAARAGLRFGDRIVAVNGVKMTGKPSLEVRDRIRGPRGSVVKVTVERAADKRIQTVEITRDVVPQPSIPDAYLIKPSVGYIDMTRGFNISTTEELMEALDQLHAQGMTSLVLDLRNNPGGFLDQAIHVAEVFLPAGQLILTQKGRNFGREYRSANNSPDTVPLVILINDNTASASEIVAGAMQDHDRALIVGETSFGKGLVQSIIPLEDGAGLTLTSAKYYTPSGRLIQRDYTNGGLYDYYTHGGSMANDSANRQAGQARKTDTGRPVYGGGGIDPDEPVGPRTITFTQRRLSAPIFAFARDVINGRVPAPASYRVRGAINFEHELKPSDFVVTEALVRSLKSYMLADQNFASMSSLIDRNRAFVDLQLRFNLVQAAYGRIMAERVFVETDDKQVARAIDVLPRARDLAMTAPGNRRQP